MFTIQCNTPIHTGQMTGNKLAPTIFPDSEIVKKMSCGRTKAASIITDVLAPASVESCLTESKTPVVLGDKIAHTLCVGAHLLLL